MTEPTNQPIQDERSAAVMCADLFCHCGQPAGIAVRMTNIQSPNWIPQCERCYHHHLECAQEVNDHEMGRFGGAYGLVTWEEREIDGAKQDPETGYLIF